MNEVSANLGPGAEVALKSLAMMIKRDLEVRVSPAQLRLFLLANWDAVLVIADLIHDRNRRVARKKDATEG